MSSITPLPKTPNVDSSVSKSLWDWLIKMGVAVNQLVGWVNDPAKQQEAWRTPSLLNGWVNYGTVYGNAGYYKDSLGIVHLRGMVKSGTIGYSTPIFYLPAGYRPAQWKMASTISSGSIGQCEISATGGVFATLGSNGWFSLDCITFRAEG